MRVLIVEDEVRLAEAIGRGLVAEGFEVDLAHTGPEGLWRASEGTYSAIVLDILLPGLNGFAVCRDLRALGDRTPILMLTAKQGEHDEAEGFDFEGDNTIVEVYVRYLRQKLDKPFGRASLQTIRTIGYRLIDDRVGADATVAS